MDIDIIGEKLDKLFDEAIDLPDDTIWYSKNETLMDAIIDMLEEELTNIQYCDGEMFCRNCEVECEKMYVCNIYNLIKKNIKFFRHVYIHTCSEFRRIKQDDE